MKNLIWIVFVWALSACSESYSGFVLKGNLQGAENEVIFLNYTDSLGQQVQDSTVIKGEVFEFRGGITEPTAAVLYLASSREEGWGSPNMTTIWLEPASLTLRARKGALTEAEVAGSVTDGEARSLNAGMKGIRDKLKALNEACRNEKDAAKAAEIKEQMEPFYEEIQQLTARFIATHPDSYVSAEQLKYKIGSMSYVEAQAAYDRLSERVKESGLGREVLEEVLKLKNGSPGSPAALFAKNDIDGKLFDLKALRGKYVIIDFWASWCVPCRKSNPHLKELYKKYKDQGLEVVCVSDDDSDENKWRAAVEKDDIGMFHHVLRGLKFDGKDFDRSEDISEGYGIHSLPTKILIDKEGMIIGRYGGGGEPHEKMDEKLKEVFGN